MDLKEFNRNGRAEISLTGDELTTLSNVLFEYCEANPGDKRALRAYEDLYIFHEVVCHNSVFDNSTIEYIKSVRQKICGKSD